MSLFEVTGPEIGRLSSTELPDLLRRLLNQEAKRHGLDKSGLNVSGATATPDGGVDGSIKWSGGPERTSYLHGRNVVFQSKAQSMTSTQAGNEVETSGESKRIKPMVDSCLAEGAAYILFCNGQLVDQQRADAIESIRAKFRHHSTPYAVGAVIDVYDQDKIADWTNEYLPVAMTVKEWLGKPVPGGLCTCEQWAALEKFEDYSIR